MRSVREISSEMYELVKCVPDSSEKFNVMTLLHAGSEKDFPCLTDEKRFSYINRASVLIENYIKQALF